MYKFKKGDLVVHKFDRTTHGKFNKYDYSGTLGFIEYDDSGYLICVFPENLMLDKKEIREEKLKKLLCQGK